MSQNVKVFFANAVFTVFIVIIAVFLVTRPNNNNSNQVQTNPSPQVSQSPVPVLGAKVDNSILVPSTAYKLGSKEAKATIVEFSDFQCPYCVNGNKIFGQLRETYGDKIQLVFRHFPLSFHPNAKPASLAAEAAGTQGKFWEMKNLLFDKQSEWSSLSDPTAKFVEYATSLKLNVDKFKTDIKSKELGEKIDNDAKDAQTAGVQGTPSFYLNGQAVNDYTQLSTEIDSILAQ